MANQVTITARIPQELSSEVATLAEALQRPRPWVVEEAIKEYVARERAFLAAVEEGLRAEEAGELVDHAEVASALDQIIHQARKQKAS